ncbi:hypothetical protein BZA05DRAFT_390801 [Tricharina praecox]|uniref:uncharacterized protein n=1 Tax=Tricharina praecox TaxID=43433 RepID=UPI0022212064|nr:uncharacterized protein BZA05DRAFT_390801 [Tricharina praecox]KAI5855195.1 hypothetical protein BZA05DRAFT_390801 [Tricharina praecox]
MDRLKSMSNAVKERIPGQEPKSSYAGYGDSRKSTPPGRLRSSTSEGGLGERFTGLVKRVTGKDEEEERVARPVAALKDPNSFAPPPKHRAAYGDDVASASIRMGSQPPPVPTRRATIEDGARPPLPPRLPPRRSPATDTTAAFPEERQVSGEDLAHRGGLSSGSVGALRRLGNSGITIPGFETTSSTKNQSSTKTSILPPPPPSPGSRPSISSLGDRFSKSNPEAPATGTTFKEKQAAIKTANSFYKDPTKVSFTDMKAAAGTARNFQQRHGEQVAEGVRVGNKLGLIPGNAETPPEASHHEPPPTPTRAHIEPPPTPTRAHMQPPPLPAKKKPPPPPPKKKPILATPSPPPPPIPAASRPHQSSSLAKCSSLPNCGHPTDTVSELPCDLDLSLEQEWFTTSLMRFPPSIHNNPYKAYRTSNSWTRSAAGRAKHTLLLSLLWTQNLSYTLIRLTWDASAPAATVKAEQRHFPPPPPLSAQELHTQEGRGHEIVEWCEQRIGTQVGNGECWTLAHDALEATAGLMSSQQTTHGACIFSHYPPSPPQKTEGVDIRRGDILQFLSAKWVYPDGGWTTAGAPDHTAVVTDAWKEGETWVCEVLEQNVGGVKIVQTGKYRLGSGSGMCQGGVRVFRAVEDERGWHRGCSGGSSEPLVWEE